MKDNKKILNNSEIWIKERVKEDRKKRRKTEAWRYKKIEPAWRSGPRQVWTIWAYRVPVVPLTQICRLPPWTAIKPNTPETRYYQKYHPRTRIRRSGTRSPLHNYLVIQAYQNSEPTDLFTVRSFFQCFLLPVFITLIFWCNFFGNYN